MIGYRLESQSSILVRGTRNCFLHHRLLNRAGAYSAFYQMGIKVLSFGVKWPECKADLSPSPGAKVKNFFQFNI
jgi:hypothetical protein